MSSAHRDVTVQWLVIQSVIIVVSFSSDSFEFEIDLLSSLISKINTEMFTGRYQAAITADGQNSTETIIIDVIRDQNP